MSLSSSDIKLSQDVDPTIRRFQAAITRDLEQLYLLMGQGLGGFSNQSPGAISQDVNTNGMGVEANQGDYTFSGPVSAAQLAEAIMGVSPSPVITPVSVFAFSSYSKTTYSTAGSFTHTFLTASTRYVAVIIAGGGGGAGGSAVAAGATGSFAGGGGGGGGSALISGLVIGASLSVTVGSGGTGGAATGATGTDGGISNLNDGVHSVSPGGGTAGGNASGGGGGQAGIGNVIDSSFFFLGMSGRNGGLGGVTQIAYNGSGAVSSYIAMGGFRGSPSLEVTGSEGFGGPGGGPTVAGTNGQKGIIVIYES